MASQRPADEPCDSDLDGALIGAALGVSPLVLVVLFSDDPGELGAGGLLAGVVGGIAGFWLGLALDSRQCSGRG